jgi:CrcB protein
MKRYLVVALGGCFGAVIRYWLSGLVSERTTGDFPWGTLVVNLAGSFFIGLFLTMALEIFSWGIEWRLFLATGVLGAFTTFSTFSYETLSLLREGMFLIALANVAAQLVGCLGAAYLGYALAKLVWS